jgi:hypothetical protein
MIEKSMPMNLWYQQRHLKRIKSLVAPINGWVFSREKLDPYLVYVDYKADDFTFRIACDFATHPSRDFLIVAHNADVDFAEIAVKERNRPDYWVTTAEVQEFLENALNSYRKVAV